MARYAYDRLTALDHSFLMLEQPNAYMHVASTITFDAAPLRKADGGIDADRIKRMMASKLHLIPRYRQKLAWIPFYNHPVWVDDERFSIDFHVRHTALPRPGTDVQLKMLSSRIMEQHLDRRRPLWEMWVVEGLQGDRMALINKVHHCMVDGISGVDLLRVLMSPAPETEINDAPTYIPRPAPAPLELMTRETLRWAGLPWRAARGVSYLLTEVQDLRQQLVTAGRVLAATIESPFHPPSSTPLNREIGPHRRFNWLTMELPELKAIRRALGGSLNDIVLTIVTGAVRRFLTLRQVQPGKITFRLMAPVSVRSSDERGALGNRVSAWLVDLPLGEADPVKQLAAITARTQELKEQKGAVQAELLTQAAEWTPSTLLSLAGRNTSRLLPFNMVVTNVPGPQFPMYLLDGKMLESFPHVPLAGSLGLGIALMSYNGKLCWGFNADYDIVPDLPAFLRAVEAAFQDLRAQASQAPVRIADADAKGPIPQPSAESVKKAGASSGRSKTTNGAGTVTNGTHGKPSGRRASVGKDD